MVENHWSIDFISSQLKQPTTFEEQLNKLEKRNLIIEDREYALQILKRINYYYITGYLHNFKEKDSDNYINGITFNHIYKIIKFDMRLRSIFLYAMEMIERSLKTNISYYFSHNYPNGNISYFFDRDFENKDKHSKFISYVKKNIDNNEDLPFIQHHKQNYQGYYPTWVAIEVFTLGNLENFYSLLNTPTQKKIAKEYDCSKFQLANWIEAMRRFRNMLAHDTRLYNSKVIFTPAKKKENNITTNKIFDYVLVMKYLVLDKEEWDNKIIIDIRDVFNEFASYIDIKCIGFPENWETILKNK
ncbi:hypothetical protein IX317_000395 [Fusobacterium sp. DD29]|uniref:Abi family protein n=1 Tax=unclassified Fusobacterium TaxID=2648384 RepID=UPI001B8D61B7|nr:MULTISPECIES: Abi family protein [unclassified Fusobacterium]MBR8700429.1 hypothetical protein [Fusobacterium sp. DD45]MBR8710178.1 hypothetical protein [Fusobacterium sp. DD28]MBR8748735.1 hypothetical protein [Fusobacterium sp. DD29]MBR8750721.1 hypothetical protein [Fusobacterium sp. DD26]MBR8761002.1 hypothetical protein [Fusobacterium sp. DD25]